MSCDLDAIDRRKKIVIEEFGGILPQWVEIYEYHVRALCRKAISSFSLMRVKLIFGGKDDEIFSLLQESLIHAAAISRFFQPPSSSGSLGIARGRTLKKLFGLSDNSPIFNRDLRNAIEHFDERMDNYFIQNTVGDFIPGPVVGSYRNSKSVITHFFKFVDPMEEICVVFGEVYDFGGIRLEIERILKTTRSR